MSVLIIKNVASEGPGTIEDFLKEKGMAYSILDIHDCHAEIPDIRDHSHLVVMGGPMSVYNINEHEYLSLEAALIRVFIKSKKPVLGICLGAQMIAYAIGANVYAGNRPEVGWDKVEITPEGMEDPIISSISVNNEPVAEVFQWHGDTFDLPKNSIRLASSATYPNQAFRYKDCVYGIQFHIEVTPEMVREWFAAGKGDRIDTMFKQSDSIYPEYRKRAMTFYKAFFTQQ